jgi:hypothetical protein
MKERERERESKRNDDMKGKYRPFFCLSNVGYISMNRSISPNAIRYLSVIDVQTAIKLICQKTATVR